MSQNGNRFAPYEERLQGLWERMVRAIGIHTVNVLMERAIWQASQKHPELAFIEHGDEGLSFTAFEQAAANLPTEQVAEAFEDLSSELMLILARLLGREMAERLAHELQAKTAQEQAASLAEEAAR
jgi:hypothetical protein